MDFWHHLKASNPFDIKGISQVVADRFSELFSRGHSIADLLAHYSDEFGHLPVETLRNMAQAHRTFQVWRRRKQQLDGARRKAKLPPLPEEVYPFAPEPDQLDALVRTARLCPLSSVDGEETWVEVLKQGADLWTRCMKLARREGKAKTTAKNLQAPGLSDYDQYIGNEEELGQLQPHRWLAMRRGVKAGLLKLEMTYPTEAMMEQVRTLQPELGPNAQERTVESLYSELITDALEPWLLRNLDTWAQYKAVRNAADAFAGLLRSSPVQSRQLGSVFLTRPGAPVAAVVVDRDGDLVGQRVIKATGPWQEKIHEFLRERGVQHVVLPHSAAVAEQLTELEEALAAEKVQVIKVRPAALSEAKVIFTRPPLRLGATSASAMVLARRAIDPLKEWSSVDPVAIGVAEYQNDLEPEVLRAALRETAELCRLERRRGKKIHMGPPSTRANPAMARLNNLVKSISDLRPGMQVHGVITNISHFGAFVNIGLPQEALVHISELSDSFVSNPNEVVSIGQQVTARVLAVEPARGRISLSLKSRPPHLRPREERRMTPKLQVIPGPRPQKGGRGSGGMRPGVIRPGTRREREGDAVSKAEALANLEKLFKK